jgi:hypothetical protein
VRGGHHAECAVDLGPGRELAGVDVGHGRCGLPACISRVVERSQ